MARPLVFVAALLVLGAVDKTFAEEPQETFAEEPKGIIGGGPANPLTFPYVVSLRNRNRHFCGGSLIGTQFVLTAAHCVVSMVRPFTGITVVTGTGGSVIAGEHHTIKNIAVHRNYVNDVQQSLLNDIAIITLTVPIIPNAYQMPTKVAASEPPEGAELWIAGWGYVGRTGGTPYSLQVLIVRAMSSQRCSSYMRGQPIFDTHICTFNPRGTGVCGGDSGGPLVYNGEIVGITSFGISCAVGMPDVYTKVPRYLGFINSITKAQQSFIPSG